MALVRKPAGEVLPGIDLYELPENYIPVEAMVMVKVLDQDGDSCWALRCTEGVSTVEIIGALSGTLNHMQATLQSQWISDFDE